MVPSVLENIDIYRLMPSHFSDKPPFGFSANFFVELELDELDADASVILAFLGELEEADEDAFAFGSGKIAPAFVTVTMPLGFGKTPAAFGGTSMVFAFSKVVQPLQHQLS